MSDADTDPRRVILDLEPSLDSISGALRHGAGDARSFVGWLELSTLLDDVRPRPAQRVVACLPEGDSS